MNKKQFWIRFGFYILFGGILPAIFLVFRFNLFQKVSKISIGGWGLVCIIFLALFFSRLVKMVKQGLPFSYLTQILNGIIKVTIPLLTITISIYCMQDFIIQLLQFFIVATVCETIAFCVNPFPQWIHDNKITEQTNNMKTMLTTLGLIKEK